MILILSTLLFSITSNLDNVVVGIAYGIKKIRIGIIANLLIASITCTGTLLSMSIGRYIAKLLPHNVANAIGSIAIALLGVYFIIQSLIKLLKNKKTKKLALKDINDMVEYAQQSDLDNSGDINIKEALFVSLGLTLNNLCTGIAASITGVNIQFTVIFTFIFSILTIFFGVVVGNNVLGKLLGKYAPLISGLLLIILSIIEFIY